MNAPGPRRALATATAALSVHRVPAKAGTVPSQSPGVQGRALSLAFVLTALIAAPASADRIDDYVRAVMEKQHIPGLSIAIVDHGKLVRARGYGFANLEQKVPAKAHTVYQIQSITKSFTATGIMLLVEEGKLRLEDEPGKYLPGLPAAWKGITLRHLLNHTSGIKDFINEPTVDLRQEIREDDVIRSVEKLPLNFPVGERYAYSNTNYHLLGMIVRKVTGKSWGDFLQERIFTPLEMRDTRILDLDEIIPHRATGYLWDRGHYRNGGFVAESILAYAGGGIRSTVVDLAKWDAALREGRVLKPASLEQMWTPGRLNSGALTSYGFGWGTGNQRGHRYLGHAGAHITGFHTDFTHFPEAGVTVVVLANRFGSDPGTIALGVAGLYRKELLPPHLMKPRRDPDRDRTERIKAALTAIASPEPGGELLTPQFAASLRANPQARSLTAQRVRNLKSFEYVAEEDLSDRPAEFYGVPAVRQVFFKMTTGDEIRWYTCSLTREGQIASLVSYRE